MDVRSWWKSVCAVGCLFVGGWGTAQAQEVISCGSVDGQYARCQTDWRGAQLLRKESNSRCDRGVSWGFDRGDIWVDRGCRGLFQATGGSYQGDYDRSIPPPSSKFGWRQDGWGSSQGGNEAYRGGFGGGNGGGFGGGNGGGNGGGFSGGNGSFGQPAGRARQVQCGSVNNAYRFCPAGIGADQQVVLENNQSDKRCKWARDWGVQDGGIWVSNGCRAVFSIR